MSPFFLLITAVIFFVVGVILVKIYRYKPWLPNYFKWKLTQNIFVKKKHSPTHLMFLYVDHFEPWEDTEDVNLAKSRMENWIKNYPKMSEKHSDADGVKPQHTWFYLIEDWQWKNYDAEFLQNLGNLSYNGFGEVEMHIHHGAPQRIFPLVDTSEKLQELIKKQKDFFAEYGSLITAEKEPQKCYGFIHGKWALDNGMDGKYCGVDNELEILHNTGCFADFTMPSGIESQSKKLNSIYYPTGNPKHPKSYNTGVDLQVGNNSTNNFVMFSGMIDVYYRNIFSENPIFEKSNLDSNEIPTEFRIDHWVNCNVHVKGRPEWVFIKVHTHGAREENFDVSFGDLADKMFSYLEKKYNDGKNYKLHYVTAREAFNIAKAAEFGKEGNPGDYRDFLIKPYANRKIRTNFPYNLITYRKEKIKVDFKKSHENVVIDFKHPFLKELNCEELKSFEFNLNKEKNKITLSLTGNKKSTISLFLPENKIQPKKIELKNAKMLDDNGGQVFIESFLKAKKKHEVVICF